jgi:4-hydroxybenzoate polyprenyltransferase
MQKLGNKTASASLSVPLAVDLDGTLIRSDSLHEALLVSFRGRGPTILKLATRLTQGKAAFKRGAADLLVIDPSLLPYNQDFLDYLRKENQSGRRIGLFTEADQSFADSIAEYLGCFDVAFGSDGARNLSGSAKVEAIRAAFGEQFTYAGSAPVDAPVFGASQSVVLVGPVTDLAPFVPDHVAVEAVFPVPQPTSRDWLRAMRIEHWAKNILVFVPLVLGHSHVTPEIVGEALLLFLALGVLASGTYILNDLFDLAADRKHPTKRARPIPAGTIAIPTALRMAAHLIGLAVLMSLLLPAGPRLVLVAYLLTTLVYSFVLKRMPIVDVMALAGLFTLRILAGSLLLPVPASPWLLSFSLLFFLGLAMVKRYAELDRTVRVGGQEVAARGYRKDDLALLSSSGIASGFAAAVLFTIYLVNDQYPRGIYGHPEWLWGMLPIILVFTLRIWHLALRGEMTEDPVVFALKDRFSLILAGVTVGLLLASWS